MNLLTRALTIACAVGAAAAAGAFLTFSTFTIGGLKRLRPAQGAAAMQSINRQATTPVFMLVLFGTGLACLLLAIDSASHIDAPFAKQRILACTIYLVGVVALTVGYHVPRNNRLAAIDPSSDDGAAYWATYLNEWVMMNHVRTAAPLVTAVILAFTLTEG